MTQFSDLQGLTLKAIAVAKDEISFITDDGRQFCMDHRQDCCESVEVEDVCGDIADILDTPILLAEEVTHEGSFDQGGAWPSECGKPEYMPESWTWTFYKLATIKGSVTIRWLGESNGYYSEAVSFYERAAAQ